MKKNVISDDYQALSKRQQRRLKRQEKYIAQKKHYLSVLYEVATCINRSQNLEDLLQRFLYTLKDVLNAEAAIVRLLDNENQMCLVASIGLDEAIIQKEEKVPIPECLCRQPFDNKNIKIRRDLEKCAKIAGRNFFPDSDIEMLVIPLQYRDKILGVYNLFVSPKKKSQLKDEHELLISIGQHLGMAIEKASVDEEARLLSIIEERTCIAHELHDSLAQTLASLRFKVRLLDDTLNSGKDELIWQEMEALETMIEDAYAELRSLIIHFRAPIDGKGIVRVVERWVERFKRETELEVFFYHNWDLEDLPQNIEIEAVRIVQEALVNVRKHSQASTVRILMHSSKQGKCSILIEDDGIGLPKKRPEPNLKTGEHMGLTIMAERAKKINGEVQFESEAGEGTLVQLCFEISTDHNKVTYFNSPIINIGKKT